MQTKIDLEQFRQETKTETDQAVFNDIEAQFANNPTLTKIERNATNPYSYIWYQDPDTSEKIAIRMANKTVQGHVLGEGTYGRAKYGVDKYGKLYAVKIQHTRIDQYYIQAASQLPGETLTQIKTKAVIQLEPGTLTVISNELYFLPMTTTQLIAIPRPQGDSDLEVAYDNLKNKILHIVPRHQYLTDMVWTSLINKLLIAANIDLIRHAPLNPSALPVDEATITHDVHLAYGKKTRRKTQAVALSGDRVNADSAVFGVMYLSEYAGKLVYHMKLMNNQLISQPTDIDCPPDHDWEKIKQLKSKLVAFARRCGDLDEKNNPGALVTGDKKYQVLQLGESSLADALEKNQIALGEKIAVTRRLLWECHKLHTGQLSRTQQGYIHCDLKPENILWNAKKKNVMLIDYGMSVSKDTMGIVHGTEWYAPVIAGTDPIHLTAANFDSTYADRVRGLGAGFDVFALKRIIRMPNYSASGARRCIFRSNEWGWLPDQLKNNIAISNDSRATTGAVDYIRTHHETALDLAMRFIAMEAVVRFREKTIRDSAYNNNLISLLSPRLSPAQQQRVCECADLIDLLEEHTPTQTAFNRQSIIDAAADSADPNALLVYKTSLLIQCCKVLLHPQVSGLKQADHEAWLREIERMNSPVHNSVQKERYLGLLLNKIKSCDESSLNKTQLLNELLLSMNPVAVNQPIHNPAISGVASPISHSLSVSPTSSEGTAIETDDGSVITASMSSASDVARLLKNRLSSMKNDCALYLWKNQKEPAPNTVYLKTKCNEHGFIMIEYMVRDESQPKNQRVNVIDPERLGLHELHCPLTKNDLNSKLMPRIRDIVGAIKAQEQSNFRPL